LGIMMNKPTIKYNYSNHYPFLAEEKIFYC
jgi:hypothetical protein